MTKEKTVHADGVYFDLPEDDYHADPALGSTDLRRLLISGPDYWWKSRHNPNLPNGGNGGTPQQIFGKALHRLVLEGNQAFTSRFVRRPDDIDRLTPAIKAALCPNGESVLDGPDYDRILISGELIRCNPELATAFEGGMPEVSVFWSDELDGFQFRAKARFDFLKPRGIGDLKSIRNYLGHSFGEACTRAIVEYRYDIQAAHYLTGRARLSELFGRGRVFGDVNENWLARVADQTAFGFQFVFFQAEGAPITWSRSLCFGNPILDIAMRDRAEAIRTYAAYVSTFGFERMWTVQDTVTELDINEMPRWYR